MATLLTVHLHPTGGPEIWPGNWISTTSFSSRNPIQLDEDGCLMEPQPFIPTTLMLHKLAPLWDDGVHTCAQILLGRTPDNRPYFLE